MIYFNTVDNLVYILLNLNLMNFIEQITFIIYYDIYLIFISKYDVLLVYYYNWQYIFQVIQNMIMEHCIYKPPSWNRNPCVCQQKNKRKTTHIPDNISIVVTSSLFTWSGQVSHPLKNERKSEQVHTPHAPQLLDI